MRGMGIMRVLAPDEQAGAIRQAIASMNPAFRWEVLPETVVAPEFRLFPETVGWHRQQLLKLASAGIVETDFYLVLDADVVATRPFGPESLVPDGHALCRIHQGDLRPRWSRDVEALLHLKSRRTGIMHAVTPAVLSREGVCALARHLDACWRKPCWPAGKRTVRLMRARLKYGAKPKPPFEAWRLYLAAGQPWTEYRLYYTFLEATNLFERFHRESPVGIYNAEHSLWHATDFDATRWDPAPDFEGAGPPYFVVLQSNTKIPPETFASRLETLFARRATTRPEDMPRANPAHN